MSIEAMKQALEALETCMYPQQKQIQAIASLRQAIEQAEKKDHAERLAEKNWQYFECPACGSEGARAFPKPMQKPEAWINWCAATGKRSVSFECESELASQPLYEGITQNTQYHYSKFHSWFDSELHRQKYTKDHPAYLAAQEAWNAANDAAQHRINRLNAEIEAWKVRFKIAEDALVKLNGPEQKPVAWVGSLKDPQPHCVTNLMYCSAAQWDTGYHLKYIPLYTSPPAQRTWVGLTEKERASFWTADQMTQEEWDELFTDIETKLKEKNA